jgi:hypothetical protein
MVSFYKLRLVSRVEPKSAGQNKELLTIPPLVFYPAFGSEAQARRTGKIDLL